MIHAAIYDPATGRIIQYIGAPLADVEADGRPFIELPSRPPRDFDQTHCVVDGALVPIA